jgi:tetratricopeptide (TPR) repeat protein
MPTVINGVGTWYYGKSRIFRRHGVCSMCGAITTLTSYDTTLFFVFGFVPLIPLGRKRILEQCAVCQKHRVAPLDKWEREKSRVFGGLNEALQSGRDPDAALVEALSAASGFEDQALFDQVAAVAAGRTDQADVQAELGAGYAYFTRWDEAETAYRAALAREDRPHWRDRLANVLLHQGRPDDAAPLITPILDAKDGDRAWLVYLLVESYQAQGRHRDALDLMDARERAFPETTADRDCQKQRKVSQKHEATGKPVRATVLATPAHAGYHEGGRFWPRFARWVGPAIAVGVVICYFVAAWYGGAHRKVYLVNGAGRPYTVTINDRPVRLEPNTPTPVAVGEGELVVTGKDIELGAVPLRVTIATPFFSRPFVRHTFVVNPDQLAAVVWEEAEYGNRAGQGGGLPPNVRAGELLYAFDGIDYEFQPFPQQIKAEKGSHLVKRRVGIEPLASTRDRIMVVGEGMSKDRQADYARRLVRINPDDADALSWLSAVLPPAEFIADLRPRLGDRPVRVDWHRFYQATVEATTPGVDLRPEYRRLVEETNRAPDAVYLLGRIEEEPAAEALYREAIAARPPSAAAVTGQGFRLIARGEFGPAVEHLARARTLTPKDDRVRDLYRQALVAARQYQRLMDDLKDQEPTSQGPTGLSYRAIALVGMGKTDEAGRLPEEVLRWFSVAPGSPDGITLRRRLDRMLACVRSDRKAYLALAEQAPDEVPFELALLRGRVREAAEKVPASSDMPTRLNFDAVEKRALVCLAAEVAGDRGLADEQLRTLTDFLSHGDCDQRLFADVLAGRTPVDPEKVRWSPNPPETKRVLLALLARRSPEHREALSKLARDLDFHRDVTSLCLRALLGEGDRLTGRPDTLSPARRRRS